MLISEFYCNKVIFLTGGSGFIGKALIEKLLRSCPGIAKIYILVRIKKGKTIQERLEYTLKDPCFRRLWKENPKIFEKVEAIEGDSCKLNLGISPNDMQRLHDVSIIIHAAATVRFDEPLREAVFMNTRGTYELLKIATNLRNLKAFVHISTAYSNPAEAEILEKVYEPAIDWRDVIKLAEIVDKETFDILTAKIINRHPNTYTFTKNLAEQIVFEYRDRVPITIFRPAIVTSSFEEPIPGWIENLNGPIGMLVAGALGLKRCEFCGSNSILALVPVDIVVRGVIISGYKLGMRNSCTTIKNELDVYNCALNETALYTLGKMTGCGLRTAKEIPFEKAVWAPSGIIYQTKLLYLLQVSLQAIPFAIFLDGVLRLKGKKPKILKLQRILVNASKALHHFMFTTWNFKKDNFLALENVLSPDDKKDFGFITYCSLDIEEYLSTGFYGVREFILKEPRIPTSGAIMRMKIMRVANKILEGIIIFFILQILYQKIIL